MTPRVEKVPVGKNRLERVSHDHNSPAPESANVLLSKNVIILQGFSSVVIIVILVNFIMPVEYD